MISKLSSKLSVNYLDAGERKHILHRKEDMQQLLGKDLAHLRTLGSAKNTGTRGHFIQNDADYWREGNSPTLHPS